MGTVVISGGRAITAEERAAIAALPAALAGKVNENAAITAGTIPTSYDVKGLVTGGHASLAWDPTNNNLKLGGAAASANAVLAILGTRTIAVPAADSVWNALDFQASTLTLIAGGVAPNELAFHRIAAPTITQTAGAAYTVPVAATVIIDGPPVASAGGGATPTLTASSALIVRSGNIRLTVRSADVLVDGTLRVRNEGHPEFAGWEMRQSAAGHLEYFYATSPALYLFFTGQVSVPGNLLVGHGIDAAATRLNVVATKTVASAAGAVYDGIKFAASTLTLTGGTQCNGSLNFLNIGAPTITDASAVTVDLAATVYIAGPPVAAGSVTLTAAASLKVFAGSIVCQGAALATDATGGFLYIPTCAGAPTGVPVVQAGTVALVYNTTDHKLYVYDGGWVGGTAPGAWS